MEVHNNYAEPWKVTLVDTGLNTMTGGRVRRIRPYVEGETFMLTYGDGVGDINLTELERFHREHGKIANPDQRQCRPALRCFGYPGGRTGSVVPGKRVYGRGAD